MHQVGSCTRRRASEQPRLLGAAPALVWAAHRPAPPPPSSNPTLHALQCLGLMAWLVTCQAYYGSINIDNLGGDYPMLAGAC